jgi:signal transduction histidine kinase
MEHSIADQVEKTEAGPATAFTEAIADGGAGLVAVIRWPDMKLLFINKQFQYYLGYSKTDLEREDVFFSALLEDYHKDLLANQLKSVDEDVPARSSFFIYPLKSKSGIVGPYYLYASPILSNNENERFYHLLMHPDLSKWGMPFTSFDTKEIFLEQFASENFGTFEWIVETDKVFWTKGLYHIYEIDQPVHEINNAFVESFIHSGDVERVREGIKTAVKEGADLDIEYKIVTAKQNVKVVHCLARPLKNTDKKAPNFAGSIRDVSSQRFIEEDLKSKVEELNHSNRELEEFAYVASHDIQEPLRKITTFSDRLSEKYKDILTGDGLLYLSRIIASAENMRTLINELLEFSRISKTEQPFEAVNLNFMLRQVISDLELTIEETKTVIRYARLPVVDAISTQMKQLFTNIISNAIKFHKPGIAPEITIDTRELTAKEKIHYEFAPNGAYHRVQVTDNGIGFEEEYAVRIFQVFQRLHGKSEYPGSGIGLAICKKILEYHHGVIYAENIPGQGARFVFIIPQGRENLK